MSIQLIRQYHTKVAKIIQYSGSYNESALRKPFQDLLEQYARARNLEMIAELDFRTRFGSVVYPDGTLKDALRQDWGFWESKDQYDDLEAEIAAKLAKGYPTTNILFEDTRTAVLYQAGQEVGRANFKDDQALDALLNRFVNYESREVREFREAIEQFAAEVPALADDLRAIIREQAEANPAFQQAAQDFLELCREAINPAVEMADAREMIIQHVLTQDIFTKIFDDPQFHQENNIAQRLGQVVNTFYHGATRHNISDRLGHYYATINARAAQIYNHQEKQKFLKALYENFYKAYNPKAADRLGIVYTPNEIVRFMIEAADYLAFKHFGKTLGDPGVEILDPATGTGTFITELIEYLPPHQLERKYKQEIHCNEVAILPYYIANLNIEFTYRQKMGRYRPFDNIVFVDTLDNLGFQFAGKQLDFFHLADENAERIQRQNERDISVIIGNPPYNTHQINANDDNPNRKYPEVDKRIQQTYIKYSHAQNLTKLYDMYTRFFRWASDRLGDEGIIAFVTNRSFINARTYDGFRKVVADEFSHIYVIDLGGDVRLNPKLSGTTHNVFGIQTGVAIGFMVRTQTRNDTLCHIYYARRPEMETNIEKLNWLSATRFSEIKFDHIIPNKLHNWINQAENDWEDLVAIASKEVKATGSRTEIDAVFKIFSIGVVTARDEWAIDISKSNLMDKMSFFADFYNSYYTDTNEFDPTIKWSRNLRRNFHQGLKEPFSEDRIKTMLYRPYYKSFFYDSQVFLNDRAIVNEMLEDGNLAICFTAPGSEKPFLCLASDEVADYHLTGAGCAAQCLPLYRYDESGKRVENITDWALEQFRARYQQTFEVSKTSKVLDKSDIFHYVYAVLHHPAYRQKYRLNLKREFPRIPFYADFWQWAGWGRQLLELHLGYESADPAPLERIEAGPPEARRAYRARLKAVKSKGVIEVDTLTTLAGIPPEAWAYRLGNRSALEWVLDRYKERKPRDPTIAEKFNSYRFVDYKEQVIDLLQRVCTVSVETMKIISQMPEE